MDIGKENGCGPTMCTPGNDWNCAFPPNMLKRMMELHYTAPSAKDWLYNEVVVDAKHMAIEAVFHPGHERAVTVHATDVHAR
jgi:hypothetical protein